MIKSKGPGPWPADYMRVVLAVALFFSLQSVFFAAQQVQLRVWAIGGEAALLHQLTDLFERENPGIKVRIQSLSWDGSYEKLITAFLGGAPPDVCQMGTTMMKDFHSMGALESLQPLYDSSVFSEQDFFPGALETNRFDGVFFGVPWYVDTRVVYYRTELIEKLGWKEFPRTWEELLKLGRQVIAWKRSRGDKNGYFMSLESFTFEMFYWQAGGLFRPPESKDGVFDVAALEKSLEFNRLLKKYEFLWDKYDSGLDYLREFDTGFYEAAISGPWMAADLMNPARKVSCSWKMAQLPGYKTNTSFIGGSNLVQFKGSRNKEAGRRLILFLGRPDVQEKWYWISKDIPANKRAMERDSLIDDQAMKVFRKQLAHVRYPPSGRHWGIFWERFYREFENFIESGGDAGKMARRMNLVMKGIILELEENRYRPVPGYVWGLIFVLPVLGMVLYVSRGFRTSSAGTDPKVWPKLAVFLLPALVILFIFRLVPLSVAFVSGFTDLGAKNISDLSRVNFLGFDNYARLYQDEVFRKSLLNTVCFVCIGVPANLFIALVLALFINRFKGFLRNFLAMSFFIPSVMTTVAAAVTWKWVYCQQSPLNTLINALGFEPVGWLSQADLALPSVLIFSVWKGFGLSMLIILAGLQLINPDLYEAVRVDGGNWFDEVWHVTFPGLRRTLFVVCISVIVTNIQFFIEPFVLTGGGPKNATLSVMLFSYHRAFSSFELGYASAVINLLFIFFCLFNYCQAHIRRRLAK